MKLLGAGSVFSTQDSRIAQPSFQFSESPLFEQPMAIDYGLAAARMALENAYYSPLDIELIISISVSPSHLSDSPEIVGPRLGHPIQRDLGARNAVVMDLLAADWSFALDVAHGFCACQGISTALIVRAECCEGVVGGNDLFVPVDGAGALLVGAPECDEWMVAYSDLAMDKANVKAVTLAESSIGKGFVQRGLAMDEARHVLLGESVEPLVHQVVAAERIAETMFICEHSYGDIGLASAARDLGAPVYGAEISAVGALGVPLALATWQSMPGSESAFTCLGFDPFKSRLACYSLEV